MESIRLRDFRCFEGRHEARLAPLTLLVGENSTGKTSVMAMIRALWEVAYGNSVPSFKDEPFDLGSFEDMVFRSESKLAKSFTAGFTERRSSRKQGQEVNEISFDTTFRRWGTAPMPFERRIADDKKTSVVARQSSNGRTLRAKIKVLDGTKMEDREVNLKNWWPVDGESLMPLFLLSIIAEREFDEKLSKDAKNRLVQLLRYAIEPIGLNSFRPFAFAPVRSRPKRTYDPRGPSRDPEGDYIPTYLAEVNRKGGSEWTKLLKRLEDFGERSKLFASLRLEKKGEQDGDPFQVHVKRVPTDPWRNLMDMGYGLSQVLPLITELCRPDSLPISLVQQPEVHLHPSAQAALGTFFCQMAQTGHQLVVETHSDHLVNRVRMDIRDRATRLNADDVSVLYFEKDGDSARIHSLTVDEQGNIDAPSSYGRFFMEEINRELKI